jgi:hypothetical protein
LLPSHVEKGRTFDEFLVDESIEVPSVVVPHFLYVPAYKTLFSEFDSGFNVVPKLLWHDPAEPLDGVQIIIINLYVDCDSTSGLKWIL